MSWTLIDFLALYVLFGANDVMIRLFTSGPDTPAEQAGTWARAGERGSEGGWKVEGVWWHVELMLIQFVLPSTVPAQYKHYLPASCPPHYKVQTLKAWRSFHHLSYKPQCTVTISEVIGFIIEVPQLGGFLGIKMFTWWSLVWCLVVCAAPPPSLTLKIKHWFFLLISLKVWRGLHC